MNYKVDCKVSYKELSIIAFMLALITYSLFFDIYRGAVFDIVPHDHYEDYAFYLLGYPNPVGQLPPETHAYRILSVLATLPFYYVMPLITFSGAEKLAIDDNHLRMLTAFSFVTYLSLLVTCMTAYLMTRKRFGGSVQLSLLVLLLTYVMLHHLREGLYGVDAMGVMVVALVLYHMNNKNVYAFLIIAGVLVNEKIVMIFLMVMGMRWLMYRPRQIDMYLLAPIIASLLYIAINIIAPHLFNFSTGNEPHRDFANFIPQFMNTLMLNFSMKGIVLNVLPVVILSSLYYLARMTTRYMDTGIYFKPSDVIALIGILVITHLVNVDYNVGRIAMYVFPLYLPLACIALYRLLPAEYKLMGEQARNA